MTRVVFRVASERTPRERKATLLTNADIQGWIKDHRSPSTAKAQPEQLELFCRRTGVDPDLLAKSPPSAPVRRSVPRCLTGSRWSGERVTRICTSKRPGTP